MFARRTTYILGLALMSCSLSLSVQAKTLDLEKYELTLSHLQPERNPITGQIDKNLIPKTDEELNQILKNSRVVHTVALATAGDRIGSGLICMLGAHECRILKSQKDFDLPVTLKVENGKIRFHADSDLSKIPYRGESQGLKIIFTSEAAKASKCNSHTLIDHWGSKDESIECLEGLKENGLTKFFSDAALNVETSNWKRENDERVIDLCEVGVYLDPRLISKEGLTMSEACRRSNFRDCSKEPSLQKEINQSVKIGIFDRSAQKKHEFMTSKALVTTTSRGEGLVSFFGDNNELILNVVVSENRLSVVPKTLSQCGWGNN